jgi:ribosomal protein L44E
MQPFVKSHLGETLDEPQLRRLLGDKLWTPHATFHTVHQIRRWAKEEGLTMVQRKRFYHGYANVMSFKKTGSPRPTPTQEVMLRCLNCGHSPLSESQERYRCDRCETSYSKAGGISEFLVQESK